ncbi:MAG TPA: hypothetical protein VG944_21865 [Fimbriimonas sp.]|nr:hypothetical protein [Fimbriimonas sp.]
MNSDWIAGPGQFWILSVSWLGSAAFFVFFSWMFGRILRSPSDGCLLGLCNLLFVVIGGMGGLLILKFPNNLGCSALGALLLPGLITTTWIRRTKLRNRP